VTTICSACLAFLEALLVFAPMQALEFLLSSVDRDLVDMAHGLRAELVRMRHVRLSLENVSRIATHLAGHT
jgi:hypothetical protein